MLNRKPLLLNCIRASLQGTLSQNDVRKLFGKAVEWDNLLNDAQISSTGPLLYYILKEANADGLLPERVMSELGMAYHSVFAHNIFYYRELSKILSSFQHSGIHAITLKGAALAEILYPDISLRPFGDIDLLIREQDLLKAESELQRLGYERTYSEPFQGHEKGFGEHFGYLRREHIPVYVEFHTNLTPFIRPWTSEAEGFWDRAVAAQIGGVPGLVLSAEDTVLHLCAHIFQHGSPVRFIWFYDLALMISKHGEGLNWKSMKQRARTLGVYRIVGFVLDQVRRTLDIPLPQDTRPLSDSCQLSWVEALSFANESVRVIWYYILILRSVKGTKDRLKLIMQRVFPSRNYIMREYSLSSPRFAFFGYFCNLSFICMRLARAVFVLTLRRILSN